MNTELPKAIDEVYALFADVPKPVMIEGCPCCLERKRVDVLLSTPLRKITPDQLTNYAASVFNTVGCVEDFLYFLPRILEISACDPDWWPNQEVVAGNLKRAEFHAWTESRKATIIHYYNAVIDDALNSDQSGWEIDSWLCALGRLFSDVSPFLSRVAKYPAKVVEYYEKNSASLIKGRLANSFWDDASTPAYDQVIKWFNSSSIRSTINAHYGI